MTDQQRNKRALIALGVVVAVGLTSLLLTRDWGPKTASSPRQTIPVAERSLEKLRRAAGSLPAKEQNWKLVSTRLAAGEKLLIAGADKDLAQEKLLENVRNLAKRQQPPLAIRSQELLPPKRRGDYGEVSIAFHLECRIEQLVNFVSDLSSEPEALATEQIQIHGSTADTKIMQVRLVIAGLVPARLIPQKKEVAEF
jgi:hypothetical protein